MNDMVKDGQAIEQSESFVAAADREMICELLLECCATLDEQRFQAWPDLFTDAARYRVTTAENLRKGYPVGLMDCFGKNMMRDRIFGLVSANVYEPHDYRHILSIPRIRPTGDAKWSVRTSFLIARTMQAKEAGLFLSGYYEDEITRTPEGAKFSARTVVLDSSLIDLLIVIPV
jgi:3-phenylpropionate/cinnamic acid dioxygenase small subunit